MWMWSVPHRACAEGCHFNACHAVVAAGDWTWPGRSFRHPAGVDRAVVFQVSAYAAAVPSELAPEVPDTATGAQSYPCVSHPNAQRYPGPEQRGPIGASVIHRGPNVEL